MVDGITKLIKHNATLVVSLVLFLSLDPEKLPMEWLQTINLIVVLID